MKRFLAYAALVALAGWLVGGCGGDDAPEAETGLGSQGSDTSADDQRGGPPSPPDAPGAGDPLPPDLSDVSLGPDDVPGWRQWQNPAAQGWLGQMMPDCDRESVPDPGRCRDVRSALERADGGDLVMLTPYPLDDEGLPAVPEGAVFVGVDQIVVAFPDDDTASLVLEAHAEAGEGSAPAGEDLPPAEPVEGLGDAAWGWDLSSDQWEVEADQPVAGRLMMFRRGRALVQIVHTWVEGEEHPDTVELGSLVDDRLSAAQD